MPEYLPTILIIAVLAVICFIAVLSIIKRANKGCCGAGGGSFRNGAQGRQFPCGIGASKRTPPASLTGIP